MRHVNQAVSASKLTTDTHVQKFDKYYFKQHPQKETVGSQRPVINLSVYERTEARILVLSKGFSFALTPKTIRMESVISSIEPTLYRIDPVASEDICIKIANIIRKAKPSQCKILILEKQALREIRRNTNLVEIPADKGNASVVLNKSDYNQIVLTFFKILFIIPLQVSLEKSSYKLKSLPYASRNMLSLLTSDHHDSISFRRSTNQVTLYVLL